MRLIKSFYNAFWGIFYSINNERNMKIHIICAFIALSLAWWYKLSNNEIMVLVLTITIVISTEMINTAIERVVDLISPKYHPLAKIAKNTAAGAVLVTTLASLVIGYYLFFWRITGIKAG